MDLMLSDIDVVLETVDTLKDVFGVVNEGVVLRQAVNLTKYVTDHRRDDGTVWLIGKDDVIKVLDLSSQTTDREVVDAKSELAKAMTQIDTLIEERDNARANAEMIEHQASGYFEELQVLRGQSGPPETSDVVTREMIDRACDAWAAMGGRRESARMEAAIIAVFSAMKRVPDWLPIRLAPMDGTQVDLWNGRRIADAKWNSEKAAWVVWRNDDGYGYPVCVYVSGPRPTHFRYVPVPPTEGENT